MYQWWKNYQRNTKRKRRWGVGGWYETKQLKAIVKKGYNERTNVPKNVKGPLKIGDFASSRVPRNTEQLNNTKKRTNICPNIPDVICQHLRFLYLYNVYNIYVIYIWHGTRWQVELFHTKIKNTYNIKNLENTLYSTRILLTPYVK